MGVNVSKRVSTQPGGGKPLPSCTRGAPAERPWRTSSRVSHLTRTRAAPATHKSPHNGRRSHRCRRTVPSDVQSSPPWRPILRMTDDPAPSCMVPPCT
eukprot:349660-Chlamydomonas_euryale.AAC.7